MKRFVSNSSFNIFRKLTIAAAALFIFALTSCFNDAKLQPTVKTQDKKAYLCFTESTETFARKVIPADITESDITKVTLQYRLSAEDNTETPFVELKSWDALGEFISEKGISLEPRTYDFKLDLFISAEENAEPVLVQSAQRNAVKLVSGINYINFDAKYVQGKGNFELTLLWEDTVCIKGLKAGLFEKQEDTAVIGAALNGFEYETLEITVDASAAGKKKAVYAKTDIPTGEYWFKVWVDNGSRPEDGGKSDFICDLVVIAPGISTVTEETLIEEQINRYYSVTYNLNGGEWAEGFTPVESHNKYQAVVLPKKNDVVNGEKMFVGWFDENGDEINFIDVETLHDTVVYAQWYSGEITIDAGNAYISIEKTDASCDYYLITEDSLTISVTDKDGNPVEDAVIKPVLKCGGNKVPDKFSSFDEKSGLFTMYRLSTSGDYQLFVIVDYTLNGQPLSSSATFSINVDFPTILYVSENGSDDAFTTGFSEEDAFATLSTAFAFAKKLASTKETPSSFEVIMSGTITGPQKLALDEMYFDSFTVTGTGSGATIDAQCNENRKGTALEITGESVPVSLNNLVITGGYETLSPGGISCESALTITDCEIKNNTGSYGGGIRTKAWTKIVNSKVLNNTATYNGGGILCEPKGPPTLELLLENVILDGNKAIYTGTNSSMYGEGGAIYVGKSYNNTSSNVYIYGNTVIGNADAKENATEDIQNGNSGNYASNRGGAIYCVEGSYVFMGYTGWDKEETEHTNVKIYGNYAPEGGAIYMDQKSYLKMASGTVSYNGAAVAASGDTTNTKGRAVCAPDTINNNAPVIEMKGNARIAENNEVRLSKFCSIKITGAVDGDDIIAPISFRRMTDNTTTPCIQTASGLALSDYVNRFSVPDITLDLRSSYGENDIYTYSISLDENAKPSMSGINNPKAKPDCVGDLVLGSGGAICKGAYDYMSSAQKSDKIAVIFYANGVQNKKNPATPTFAVLNELDEGVPVDNVILGVGANQPDTALGFFAGNMNNGLDASVLKSEFFNCTPLNAAGNTNVSMNLTITYRGDDRITQFSGNTDGKEAYESFKAEIIADNEYPNIDSEEAFLESFPVFKYAEEYGETWNLPEEYRDGWYIPSIAELSALHKASGSDSYYTAAYTGIHTTAAYSEYKYWTSSYDAADNQSALTKRYTVNFYNHKTTQVQNPENILSVDAESSEDTYVICIRNFAED